MPRSSLALIAACVLIVSVHAPREVLSAPITFLGSWPTTGIPCGLALGGNGTLYVGDEYNNIGLRLFSPTGLPMGIFPGDAVETYGIGILSDQSVVFTDYWGRRVLHYAPDGTFLSQFATGGQVSGWLTVDGSDNIYVVDDPGDRVRKFTSTGALVADWYVNHPAGIAFTEGKVFVAETFAGNINIFSPDGVPQGSFPTGAGFAQQLRGNGTGQLYLGDHGNHQLRCFTTGGTPLWTLGPAVPGYPFPSADPTTAVQAPDGTLFVGDFLNRNVLIFSPMPTATTHDTFGALKARYRK